LSTTSDENAGGDQNAGSDEDAGGPPAGDSDLDGLIGELRREASRRRAAPDFPIDAEAQLSLELDRQAPRHDVPKLDRLAEALEVAGRVPTGRRFAGLAPAGALVALHARLGEHARLVAAALRFVSWRLSDHEGRLTRLEGDSRAARPGASATQGGDWEVEGWPGMDAWLGELRGDTPALGGRVLCCGGGVEGLVAHLRSVGDDAYGLVPGADPYLNAADIRSGELAVHLRTVAPEALREVIVAGPVAVVGPVAMTELAGLLARVTSVVVVLSEAPWAWSERVGPELADVASRRPFAADTWLAALDRAGFTATAAYSAEGRSYKVSARR
jgi:hypothetical protein